MFITKILWAANKKSPRAYTQQGFKDSLRILATGGNGGNGLPKFGGVGGNGGDVKAVGRENLTLNDVYKANQTKRYKAKPGRHSSHNFILGVPGESLQFDVPVGVTVLTETGKKLGEINKEGDEVILAHGGRGGNPKNRFLGTQGQSQNIILDLKLIADIGLVGFPNAGKSTLLKAISHARPKIASYPFTTIRPNLGIISYPDLRQISMADLPGLIEGAYLNKGMGHKFLKHVERTKLLLLVVDVNGFQLSPQYPHRSCLETILLLNRELELYNKDLLSKPSMILINKMDTEGAQEKYEEIRHKLKNLSNILNDYAPEMRPETLLEFSEIMAISAKENEEDIAKVKVKLRRLLDITAELQENADGDITNFHENLKKKLVEHGPRLV